MNRQASTRQDPASFRDPNGRVLHVEGRVLRALTSRGAETWRLANEKGAIKELVDSGLMVSTRELANPPAEAKQLAPGAVLFLEHERIPLITWPAEWTFSMLADTGLLTLEIQQRLTRKGLTLQDATAYNVAFVGARPVFLDVTSITRAARLDVWYALGQCQRMFLYPLYAARRGLTPQEVFSANLDGLTPAKMAKLLGRLAWLSPGYLLQVFLPHWLEGGKSGANKPVEVSGEPKGNPQVQLTILNGYIRRLRRLREKRKPTGVWVDYAGDHSYSDEDERQKQAFVADFGKRLKGKTVADLGANTGVYSRILADAGCRVVALEMDHDALDALYRKLHGEARKDIELARINLAAPTPGIGFMNRERESWLRRHPARAGVALALVHHLMVSAGLTLHQVVELFARLADHLVVEYVDPADEMFRQLVAGREDLWSDLTENGFTQAFADAGFCRVRRLELKDGKRIVMEFESTGGHDG